MPRRSFQGIASARGMRMSVKSWFCVVLSSFAPGGISRVLRLGTLLGTSARPARPDCAESFTKGVQVPTVPLELAGILGPSVKHHRPRSNQTQGTYFFFTQACVNSCLKSILVRIPFRWR